MNREETLNKIKEVEDFTCNYWWPAYIEAQKHSMDTPTLPSVIANIIETRGRFIRKLKESLKK